MNGVVALAWLLAMYWLLLSRHPARWLTIGYGRIAHFQFWVARAWLLFGGGGLIALAMLGQVRTLLTFPAQFLSAAWFFGIPPAGYAIDTDMIATGLAGLAGGALVGILVGRFRAKRRRRQFMLGDVSSLLPRHRAELPWVALLAISAGITEELFFRLALPLTIGAITGASWIGFVASAILFALAHRYQGWTGMLATTALAALFTSIYLATGSLWLTMALHALIDLNSLVLRPLLLGLPVPGGGRGADR